METQSLDAIWKLGYEAGLKAGIENRAARIQGRMDEKKKIIIEECCSYFNMTFEDMCLHSRKRILVVARQTTIYFLCKYAKITKVEIGRTFGYDHTTIIHSASKITGLLFSRDEMVCNAVVYIEEKIIQRMFPNVTPQVFAGLKAAI